MALAAMPKPIAKASGAAKFRIRAVVLSFAIICVSLNVLGVAKPKIVLNGSRPGKPAKLRTRMIPGRSLLAAPNPVKNQQQAEYTG
jgi:hypothetical protein